MTKSNPTEHTIKKGRRTKKREATDTEREIDLYCHSPVYGPNSPSYSPVDNPNDSLDTEPAYGPNSPSYSPVDNPNPEPRDSVDTEPAYGPNSPSFDPLNAEPAYGPDSPSYHPPEEEIRELNLNAIRVLTELNPREPIFEETAPNVFEINVSPPALLFRGEVKESASASQSNNDREGFKARIQISNDEEFKVLCREMTKLLLAHPGCKEFIAKSASRYIEKTTGVTGTRHVESSYVIREFPLLSGRRYDPRNHHDTTLAVNAVVIFDGIRVYADRFGAADFLSRFHYIMSRSVAEVERITQIMYGLAPI